MKLKIVLSTASALALLTGAAWAGSGNTLYIQQQGSTNTANVNQGTGPGDNNIGTLADPVTQDGNTNFFQYSNAGCCNEGSRQDNDVKKAEQDGNGNWMNIAVWNLSDHNRINSAIQDGNDNALQIEQNDSRSGRIDSVLQDGSGNVGLAKQNGSGNRIVLMQQIGSNNGNGRSGELTSGRGVGSRVIQAGSNNLINESSVVGSNNKQAASNTYTPPHDIQQLGNNNGRSFSTASTLGSNGNGIKVTEHGDWNNFSVKQGLSVRSTGNYATVDQQGSYNNATATQYGSGNHLVVSQILDGNRSTTNFDGNDNGVGTLGGAAGTLAGLPGSRLVQGTVLQDSTGAVSGNLVNYDVFGSGNLFALAQIGGNNTITGTVGTGARDSNNNQVAVLQQGNSNTSSFSQTGGSNNLAVSQ